MRPDSGLAELVPSVVYSRVDTERVLEALKNDFEFLYAIMAPKPGSRPWNASM